MKRWFSVDWPTNTAGISFLKTSKKYLGKEAGHQVIELWRWKSQSLVRTQVQMVRSFSVPSFYEKSSVVLLAKSSIVASSYFIVWIRNIRVIWETEGSAAYKFWRNISKSSRQLLRIYWLPELLKPVVPCCRQWIWRIWRGQRSFWRHKSCYRTVNEAFDKD